MAIANLNDEKEQIVTGMDNIVIVNNLESYRGGRTLDVTGYVPTTIMAGSLVIKETATGEFKPMPVISDGTAYDALPDGHEYAGVVVASVPVKRPFVGIMYAGTVNDAASPYPLATILAAVKTALPQLTFLKD